MPRLCESDYRDALAVLREAGAVDGPDPFLEPVLEALRRLVPCDVVAYHEGRPISHPALVFAGEPRGEMTPSIRDAHERYLSEDPLTPVDGARKYSDYFSQRQFRRLGLYREVARPVGVQDMIRLWVDPRRRERSPRVRPRGLGFPRARSRGPRPPAAAPEAVPPPRGGPSAPVRAGGERSRAPHAAGA